MSEQILLSTIPLPDLLKQFREIIRQENQAEQIKQPEKFLSLEEARKVFQPAVGKSTLINWSKDGKIPVHRIAGRVYYKASEILAASQTLKKYRK